MSTPSTPDTIVLVHGFWVTPRSWEDWVGPIREARVPRADPGIPRI